MAKSKTVTYQLEGVGPVLIQKKKGTKRVSVRIDHDGNPKVTLPYFAPYKFAYEFVESRKEWIMDHATSTPLISDGSIIGNQFRINLQTTAGEKYRHKLKDNSITISIPASAVAGSDQAQEHIRAKIIESLRSVAKKDFPKRIRQLSETLGLEFNNLTIKKTHSRWGSCSRGQNINLSLYLAQLDQSLVEYVMIHELCHTKHLNHSKSFWTLVEKCEPNHKELRKTLKSIKPTLLVDEF